MSAWCKVENGVIVDGPRAWENNTPPDSTWLPHRLADADHTINDNFDGSVMIVGATEVVEQKQYSPKSQAQIDDEVSGIKSRAADAVAVADAKLADSSVENKAEWQSYKDAYSALLNVTALSWDYYMPSEPV